MKLNIGKKILGSILVLAILVIIAASAGMITNVQIARTSNPVLQEKIPLKTVSMEALLVAEKSQSACRKYLLTRNESEEAEQFIRDALTGFSMCIAMLAMGTESPAFLESPEGALYRQVGLSMKLPAPSGEVQEIAEELQGLKAEFAVEAEALMAAHRQRIQYSFEHNGTRYDVPGFLYEVIARQRDIVRQIESFVEFGIEVSRESMDPAQSMFGSWYSTFTSQDQALHGVLEELTVYHSRFFKTAQQVIEADAEMRPVYFATLLNTMNQLDHLVFSPVMYSKKRISETEVQEQAAIQELMATYAKISAQLQRLNALADDQLAGAIQKSQQDVRGILMSSGITQTSMLAGSLIVALFCGL